MADGEIEVSVKADGVDEAAGELGGAGGDGGAGDDVGGAGGGGGGGGGKTGSLGKLLTRILGLVAFLGPLLEVVGVVANVLTAFVAPLAVTLLRLLTPLLRLMLAILPAWFAFTERLNGVIEMLMNPLSILVGIVRGVLLGIDRVKQFLNGIGDTLNDAKDDLRGIVSKLQSLPGRIADLLPDLGVGGDGGLVDRGRDALGFGDSGDSGGSIINIGGGLEPFVDRITRDGSLDFS